MKKLAVFAVLVMSVFILMGVAQAADKLAYIDLSKTFAEYGKTKDYDKTLADKEKAYEGEREKKVSDIKAFQDKWEMLSDKEKESKKAEREAKIKAFQEFDKQRAGDLRKEQDEKMREILKDIEDAVKKYAEKEGFAFVFNDRVLVYQDKTLNITDKILTTLNGGYTKGAPAPKKN